MKSAVKRKQSPTGWLSRADLARVFDVTLQGLDKTYRKHFPPECIAKDGVNLIFYARGCIEGWAAAVIGNGRGETDALLVGANSPWMERYREERARIARLDRLEREGSLLPRDQVHQQLLRLAKLLRMAGDALQRKYGPEAAKVLEDALTAYEQEVAEGYGGSDS